MVPLQLAAVVNVLCVWTAGENCTDGDVRLVRGGDRNGTVQICIERTWGTICDSLWDSREATVVCNQLGFPVLG